MATVVNDFVQGIIMLFGITAVILAVLKSNGGFIQALTTLSQYESDLPVTQGMQGAFVSFFGPDPLNLLGVVVLTSLGKWGLPQMVGKFYAIKDERSIKAGTVISTIFAIIVAGGCYFLGGFGRLYSENPSIQNADGSIAYDAIVPAMLSGLPDILIGIVVVLVLSASMSTLASLVLTSSSTMTLDLIYRDKKSLPGEVEDGSIDDIVAEKIERRKVIVMRVLIMFFIAISLLIALNPPTFIAQLMGISWGALAGAFLAPFMLGLYWRGVTTASVWACFIWGVGITVVNMLIGNPINPINCGAIAMVGGFPVVWIVSLLTKKLPQQTVDSIFDCYHK
jgi:SSS family solute:Na+ symporter